MSTKISLLNFFHRPTFIQRFFIPLLDKFLGISQMNALYHKHAMQGLSKEAFADTLLKVQDITIENHTSLLAQIPELGPVVIASNHPFGGIEGVILARLISEKRPDLKVLANQGLKVFKELEDYFIFTNPLSPNDPKNAPSLRAAISHVKNGHPLLIFPAGRVSYYQSEHQDIVEHQWNKIVYRLAKDAGGKYIGVFVQGFNRPFFYTLGRIYYRLRMLMLARELLANTHRTIRLDHTQCLTLPLTLPAQTGADFARSLSYAVDSRWTYTWPADNSTSEMVPLATEITVNTLISELAALPTEQCLISVGEFSVYWSMQAQTPRIVDEIARLRERVFRMHNEGSGEALDTDGFDATYTHLFVVHNTDEETRIIGAYRMGLTDKLIAQNGLDGLYLHKMFQFAPEFINQQRPCLEMGRSFVIPEYQRSPQGLFMLWRGIGEFMNAFPEYRVLYGTVSISKLYTPQSVSIIEQGLVNAPKHVHPRHEFELKLHPQLQAFGLSQSKTLSEGLGKYVNTYLQALESDGKELPVLAKQYQQLGANFHALGIDTSFNHTPGLLLSVNMENVPARLQKRFLGRTL
jgi:putative hemolysin